MWMRSPSAPAVALFVLVALPVFASSLTAQETRGDAGGLTVYSEADYGGQQASLRVDTPKLEPFGTDNRVASLRVEGQHSWELCAEVSYGGRCLVVPRSEPNLASKGWRGRVASARRIYGTSVAVTGTALSGIVLYGEPEFRGSANTITTEQRTLADSTAPLRSLRVRAGMWEVCESPGFRGRCALVTGDIPDVGAVGFPDHVGSLRLRVNLR